jgi:hypothetical protein
VQRFHYHSETRTSSPRLYPALAPLILSFCLVVLFIGVWNHVRESEQPPFDDSLGYMLKAKVFWDMVGSGHWKNPFDLEPVFKPPGTVLMSYPFGFSEDYKGFLFRSAILPVLLFVSALCAAASRKEMSRRGQLDLVAVGLILASLPCFYHFEVVAEVNSPVVLGLVDNFLAAVSALAFGIGYRAIQKRSWFLVALSSLLTGLCLIIKPAGVIVALVIISLLILIKITSELVHPGGKLLSRHLFLFVITLSAGTALLLVVALKSEYLSHEMIALGNTAMTVLRNDFASTLSLNDKLYPSFGLNGIILGLTSAFAVFLVARDGIQLGGSRWTLLVKTLNPLLAAVVLSVGAAFWLIYTDQSQVRYLYPFAFLSLILLSIFLLDAIEGRSAPYTRLTIYGTAAVLFGGLTAMLYFHPFDTYWERAFGVNFRSPQTHEFRILGDLLLQRANDTGRDLDIYALDPGSDVSMSASTGTIAFTGDLQKILRPTKASFYVRTPVDFQRPSAVRFRDLVSADYILYYPGRSDPDRRSLLTGRESEKIAAEVATTTDWLMQAHEECGVKDVVVGKCAIKLVVNPKLFAESLAHWATTYSWRDVFQKENSNFFKMAARQKVSDDRVRTLGKEATEIFDRTIAIDKVEVETVSPLIFAFDWRALLGHLPDDVFFFVHVLDGNGKILSVDQIPLNSMSSQESNPTVSHHTEVKTHVEAAPGTLRYGFGLYQGSRAERLLTPDPPGSDFQGKRVVREVKLQ